MACCSCGYHSDKYIELLGERFCQSCYNRLRNCDICGGKVSFTTCAYHNGNRYCPICFKKAYNKYPAHYNGKTRFFYMKKRKNPLYIGVELEIQGGESEIFAKNIFEEFPQAVIVKVDDSISYERGCEIVSNPMTMEYTLNQNIWKRIFDLIKTYRMNDISGCGLHFHIDRKYLEKYNLVAKIDYIVNNFYRYWEEIGGRRIYGGDWCDLAEKDIDEWGIDTYEDRYRAVNLTNKNTVELRFCKSTDDYDVFMNRMLNIYLLIQFCKNKNIRFNMAEKDFIKRFEKFKEKEMKKFDF